MAAQDFAEAIAEGYAVEGPAIDLGRGVHDGKLVAEAAVRIPLAMMNRHGLVAGATGTGKTRTLQLLAEALSGGGRARVRRRRQGRPLGSEHLRRAPRRPQRPRDPCRAACRAQAAATDRAGRAAAPAAGACASPRLRRIGDFLRSRQGRALQRQVLRGVFGMLRKRL